MHTTASTDYTSALRLIQCLEQAGYKRLMVIRVDFMMRSDYQHSTSILNIQSYRKHLWNNRRGKPAIFRHCLGYVWGMEYTAEAGYHYHCLFLFDGDYVQADTYYGDQIGEYWKFITGGKGSYHNCNSEKDKYQHLGIGRIRLNNAEELGNLCRYVIPYLAKDDRQVQSAIQLDVAAMGLMRIKVRTFGCSNNLKL
ncbi:hypothetical protein BI347_17920 [Chromobacterium sphagni]|uniref:YagK/YfjJ C-terminal domain-containing protein n=1 Tax=Chromobacterium sphagni TaxID=1903179 RepID=A0A1S1WW58_9NEIS|nr:inovirus-type Gp2 protein [Chromobacterium sphagni]OHX11540.1 hypothetical protein BI347_17920 [Chromobacterium sphagni]